MLKIDEEFKALIPPLTDEEFQQLEKNLLKDGCRDSLVVWNGTLIDGHNRFEICSKNNIPFNTKELEFSSKDDAIEWIIRNQFGRRNLPPYARIDLAEKLEEVIRLRAKENMIATQNNKTAALSNLAKQSNIAPIDTRKEIAKISNTSTGTVMMKKVIDKHATPEQKEKLRKGEAKISTVYEQIKPSRPKEEPKRRCNVCGINRTLDHYHKGDARCRDCHSFIKTAAKQGRKVDVEALKAVDVDFEAMYNELKNEKPSKEGNSNKLNTNTIISDLINLLNSFHIEINRFSYMPDIKEFEDVPYLLTQLERVNEDITKIKKILGGKEL